MSGIVYGLSFALLMGVASIFSRRGLERESFEVLLVVSLAIGTPIFLLLTVATTGFEGATRAGVFYAAVGAVIGSVLNRSVYFTSIKLVGPGKALAINATSPLFAALLSWLVLDETISALVAGGTIVLVLGVIGVSEDARSETDRSGYPTWFVLIPFVGAILAATSVVIRKIALDAGIEPVQAGAVNMVVGFAVAGTVVGAYRGRSLLDADRQALKSFSVASVLMAVGFVFYFVGLRTANVSVFFPIMQTQPLFALTLSALFLSELEIVTTRTALSGTAIVAGSALVILG
jgi:drug/metabolite transporter (DMT)-like permease